MVEQKIQEAVNRTDILNVQREQVEQNRRLALLEKRINWIFTTLVGTLLVGLISLTFQLIKLG